ncbi:uncharacterized protein LOC131157165 isoform X2 [Malania oleifera]|uniref:uncharacterized protein LOC131157165 isoform X2 n=1 Tax=Malania oleifera TaxID=397392 RepID=UPI0025AEAC37|nr:uncharacterized protein LOC131157165 isoform X2 [Malania oleifera]
MIICRSFLRVDRAWKFTNTSIRLKPVKYFQGCCYYQGLSYRRKMNGAKDMQNVMDRNKKPRMITEWKPKCTQSNSNEEFLLEDVEKLEVESQPPEVSYCISKGVSNIQDVSKEGEGLNQVDACSSSHALHAIDGDKTLEGRSIPPDAKHSISIQVGAPLIRFIKGKGGSTQKKIEEDMGVIITFPSSKKEDSIIIEGNSIESVTRASEEIQFIIDEAVKSRNLDYTHFVSLPLAIHSELVDKLVNFQNSILGNSDPVEENLDSDSDGGSPDDDEREKHLDTGLDVVVQLKVEDGNKDVKMDITNIPLTSYPPATSKSSSLTDLGIDKSIFIKPKTFHLTVLMLKLWNKERIDAASAVLQSVSSKVIDALGSRPVFVKLKGLYWLIHFPLFCKPCHQSCYEDCMRGSLSKARVLYAPVEEVGSEKRLLQACQVIIDAYVETGLVLEKDAQQKLKLHATVMNARHRKRKKRSKKFDSFDARGIAKQYGTEEWGQYLIREAHLSQRKHVLVGYTNSDIAGLWTRGNLLQTI